MAAEYWNRRGEQPAAGAEGTSVTSSARTATAARRPGNTPTTSCCSNSRNPGPRKSIRRPVPTDPNHHPPPLGPSGPRDPTCAGQSHLAHDNRRRSAPGALCTSRTVIRCSSGNRAVAPRRSCPNPTYHNSTANARGFFISAGKFRLIRRIWGVRRIRWRVAMESRTVRPRAGGTLAGLAPALRAAVQPGGARAAAPESGAEAHPPAPGAPGPGAARPGPAPAPAIARGKSNLGRLPTPG
jgi:hypothetical protein